MENDLPGVRMSGRIRKSIYIVIVPLMSAYLIAAPLNGAMLYATGFASVNGTAIQHSSAIFPGDLIHTGSTSQASIAASGASITVFSDSSVRFETSGVSVLEGSINVGGSQPELAASAGRVKVTPASNAWTEYEISHRNGAVQIVARKGELLVNDGTSTMALAQGQSETRDDSDNQDQQSSKRNKRDNQPAPAATTSAVDSPIVIGVAAGAILGGLVYALTRSGEPVSPVTP